MVPRIIHQVWFGEGIPTPPQDLWHQKWKDLHPQWQVKLWKDDGNTLVYGDEVLSSSYPSLLESCTVVQKSEVWRLELLLQQGGVYVDTDIEPLKALDSLLQGSVAAVSPQASSPLYCASSFLAATQGHPWVADMHSGLTKASVEPTISKYVTEVTRRHPEVRVLDPKYIMQSLIWHILAKRRGNTSLDPSTVAVHHFFSTLKRAR